MHRVMNAGLVPEYLHDALLGWIARNVDSPSGPRSSGDDIHESVDAQLGYFLDAGLSEAQVVWQRELWAVLYAVK